MAQNGFNDLRRKGHDMEVHLDKKKKPAKDSSKVIAMVEPNASPICTEQDFARDLGNKLEATLMHLKGLCGK